jgi:hypothetical protein
MSKDTKATYLILTLLLLLAAVLRLFHSVEIPYIEDEVTLISKAKFGTLSELISKWVITDIHPAGMSVFLYYWIRLVGDSEIATKLPFIICGILSVLYVFLLGREWFNATVGLVCAAFVATIQYTIMYSQLVRPYSSGLLFCLVMVWYWTKVVFPKKDAFGKPKENLYKNLFLYVLFSAMCAYNHHLSLLFAAMVGLTGLVFVRGKSLLKYMGAGIGIFVLYIPHLHILFCQLKMGGSVNWLPKPGNDYMIQYIDYILQYSTIAYILAGFLVLLGLINLLRKKNISAPYYFISIAWFLLPFLIIFFYSRYVSTIMEYSGLIFSFPFMLYSVFGLLPNLTIKPRFALVVVICCINVFVLVNGRKYYTVFYQSYYARQVIINDSLYKKVGENNLTMLMQRTPDSISSYYFRKYHSYLPYVWMPDSSDKQPLVQYLEKHKTPYLTYNNVASSNLSYLPIILNYYPYVVLQNQQQGGTNYIFSSVPSNGKSPYIFQSVNDFEKPCEYWGESDKSFLADTISFSGKHSYKADSLHEWPPGFTCDLDKMITNKHDLILVSVALYPLGTMKDIELVISIETSGGKQISWSATPVSAFIPDSVHGKWMEAYYAFNVSSISIDSPNMKVKVYIWNRGKRNFYMDDFAVKTMEGDPYIYWLTNRI